MDKDVEQGNGQGLDMQGRNQEMDNKGRDEDMVWPLAWDVGPERGGGMGRGIKREEYCTVRDEE